MRETLLAKLFEKIAPAEFSGEAAFAVETDPEGKIVEAETVSPETGDAEADGEAEAVEAEAEAEGEARPAEVFAGDGVTEEAAAG